MDDMLGRVCNVGDSLIYHDIVDLGTWYKICLLLTQLAIPFKLFPSDISEERRMPVLVNTNSRECLSGSTAIMVYLSEGAVPGALPRPSGQEHAEGAGRVFPTDRWQRAKVIQWLCFEEHRTAPYIVFMPSWTDPYRQISLDPYPNETAEANEDLEVMEKHLTQHFWFGGETTRSRTLLYLRTPISRMK